MEYNNIDVVKNIFKRNNEDFRNSTFIKDREEFQLQLGWKDKNRSILVRKEWEHEITRTKTLRFKTKELSVLNIAVSEFEQGKNPRLGWFHDLDASDRKRLVKYFNEQLDKNWFKK
jgi:hypothetical protein